MGVMGCDCNCDLVLKDFDVLDVLDDLDAEMGADCESGDLAFFAILP